jgi:hypothetical protein
MTVMVPRDFWVGYHPDHKGVCLVFNAGATDELIIPMAAQEAFDAGKSLKKRGAQLLAAAVNRPEVPARLDS